MPPLNQATSIIAISDVFIMVLKFQCLFLCLFNTFISLDDASRVPDYYPILSSDAHNAGLSRIIPTMPILILIEASHFHVMAPITPGYSPSLELKPQRVNKMPVLAQ